MYKVLNIILNLSYVSYEIIDKHLHVNLTLSIVCAMQPQAKFPSVILIKFDQIQPPLEAVFSLM